MRRYLWRCAFAVSFGLASGAWLIGCGDTKAPTEPASTGPAPAAVSPAAALRELEWLFNHRAVDTYRTLLSGDFRFFCSPTDSAGNPWRSRPWTREDELAFATHFFLGGGAQHPVSSVQLTLDRNIIVYPDPEFPWDTNGRWHRNVRTQIVLRATLATGEVIDHQGHASFGLVRGDSAVIQDRDSTRWYLRRWDEETNAGGGPLRSAQPASDMTMCELKALYH